MTTRPPPLAGIRVLDFTRVLAGPWATLTLADLGADVIKVENPKGGDDTRGYDLKPELNGEAAYFAFANRNKRSICVDITRPEGQALVKRLAPQVDILIENFRPDVMARQGLDYDALKTVAPQLIYCSISGYGHSSPLKLIAGYDPVAQAESGMMAVTGEPDGDPLRTSVSYGDIFTGMFALQGILAALHARQRDGVGQFIDVALLDSCVGVMANYGQNALITGEDAPRFGNSHPFLEPFGPVQAADGMLELIVGNQGQWERMCHKVIERPDLLDDPRFATNAGRMQNRQATRDLLAGIFGQDTRANWMRKFHAAGVPAGSIRNVREALAAPEVRARDMVAAVEHPVAGRVEMIGSPIKLSGTPVRPPAPWPGLGEHTTAVLGEFGLGADEIDALAAAGVLNSRKG
jgi:crotonobetainyl-CoA:carnitine CoA-transferase CaiB-like acyl-CoA transferase